MSAMHNLNSIELRLLEALLRGDTPAEIQDRCGLNSLTVDRMVAEPHFAQALEAYSRSRWCQFNARVQAAATQALELLTRALTEGHSADRQRAATLLLAYRQRLEAQAERRQRQERLDAERKQEAQRRQERREAERRHAAQHRQEMEKRKLGNSPRLA